MQVQLYNTSALNDTPIELMPIKIKPYQHQVQAFDIVCGLFGTGGQTVSRGAALLMEMGTGKSLVTTLHPDGMLLSKMKSTEDGPYLSHWTTKVASMVNILPTAVSSVQSF